jgi:N-formylglutamate deformylase
MNALDLDQDAFLKAVEATSMPAEAFDHRAHLRLAWICLRRGEGGRVAGLIQAFAVSKGAARKFDAALTEAWMERMRRALAKAPDADFEAFLAQTPELTRPTRTA